MSIERAVQVGIRARLASTPSVTALVPADNILDRNQRPTLDPSIIIGESQVIDDGDAIARDRTRVIFTLHVWKREPSLAGVKAIAWEIRTAIRRGRLALGDSFHCADCLVSSSRSMRDPGGEFSHAVVTIETLVQEVA